MEEKDVRAMADAMNNKNKLKRSDIKRMETLLEQTLSEIADLKKLLKKEKKEKKRKKSKKNDNAS